MILPTSAPVVFAHGIGERADLPIPFGFALAGAAVALVVSFALLAFAWRTPRFDSAQSGFALPMPLTRLVDSRAFRNTLRGFGLLVTAYVAVAAFGGPDLRVNPTFGAVYVLLWVGLVPASLVFGPVWRLLNPLRTLHQIFAFIVGRQPSLGIRPVPTWTGYWPAAAGLFAFVWLELVAPGGTTLSVVTLWFAIYAAIHLVAAAIYGSRWFDQADAFEVYSALFARLSPLARRESDQRLVLRNPLTNLDALPVSPGLVAVVSVLLGSTAFDGFSGGIGWIRIVQESSVPEPVLATGALLGFVLAVAITFWLATRLAGGLAGDRTADLPGRFGASVVPIILGYLVAHYFTLLVYEGQRTLIELSDPLFNGSNLLGTGDWKVHAWITDQPSTIAAIKVGAVVTGHILGIVAAHDKAVQLFPRKTAIAGQVPLLIVMVFYTVGGLTLLFAT